MEERKHKVSLVLLMKDEEYFIESYLMHHYKYFDEIIIIDDNSTDASRHIITQLCLENEELRSKVKVFERALNNSFGKQRNFAHSKCNYNWVMHLDADERMPFRVMADMDNLVEALETRGILACAFPRMNFLDGVQSSEHYPDYIRRLLARGVEWVNDVHEVPMVEKEKTAAVDIDTLHWGMSDRWAKAKELYARIQKKNE